MKYTPMNVSLLLPILGGILPEIFRTTQLNHPKVVDSSPLIEDCELVWGAQTPLFGMSFLVEKKWNPMDVNGYLNI